MSVSTEFIWESLGEPLRGYFNSQLGDPSVADDLLQECFMRIHQSIDSLQDDQRMTSWVYAIARNVVRDHLRKHQRSSGVHDDGAEVVRDEDADDRSSFLRCFVLMVDALPERYREVVRWTELDGLSQRQVSEQSGLSLSGVKSRVQRGRRMLKQMLLACCELRFDHSGLPVDCERSKSCRPCDGTGDVRPSECSPCDV